MQSASSEKRPEGFPGQRLVIIPPAIAIQAARKPITRDLCVTHIGHFSAAKGHRVERLHGTSQQVLIGCISGNGFCELGDREWKIETGDLVFLPPRERHVYGANSTTPWTIFWIHFRGLRTDDYLSSLNVSTERAVISVDDIAVIYDAFEDTFRHVTHGFGDAAMIGMSTAFARLLGLVKIHQRAPGNRSRRVESRLLKVLARMREDLAHPWTLDELARETHISVPHFTEICRRQTGMSPVGLLIRLRLQRAMDLLQQGTHNVSEAAHAVGYDDAFYFSRLFRKHMGIPPSSCRQGP